MGIESSFFGVFRNKKILITGDTGLKGSWLSIWLLELGAEVFGYALPPKTLRDNYVTSRLEERIKHQDGDIRDYEKFYKFAADIKPDIAFHLAAQPLVIDSYNDPRYTFETNIMGTVNFLDAVRNISSIRTAVVVTSDKCYQNNEWVWGYRENDPMGGKDPYSASKGCAELVSASFIHSYFSGRDVCSISSVRAGNVLGGGDWAENRIVPDFYRAVERNEPLLIRYPESTRPWQHILEPLSGYLLLAAKQHLNPGSFHGGWNFGPLCAANKSVAELVDLLIKNHGAGAWNTVPRGSFSESKLLQLDISKATTLLLWKPVLSFSETVKFVVDDYRDHNQNYRARVDRIQDYCLLGINHALAYF
jgi:CDP-glucose 4,6-dehydratase